MRLLTISLWLELKCAYRCNNHENISDRELSLTTWFLSVTIWANHHKPQFQRRYLGLQPFTFHPRIVLVLFYRIIRVIIQNSLHRNKNREEASNREIRYLPDPFLTSSLFLIWCKEFWVITLIILFIVYILGKAKHLIDHSSEKPSSLHKRSRLTTERRLSKLHLRLNCT